ncbi:MAG: M24 family metallopeptidase [Phycisphaerae bacterium]|nr:M24 family metallopeptidase [Phycisphaerae bacterium]
MTFTEEIAEKQTQVAAFLDRHKCDIVFLTERCNFAWLTAGGTNHVVQGSDTGVATLAVTRDAVRCVTNTIEGPRMRTEELRDRPIAVIDAPWYDAAAQTKIWADLIGGRKAVADKILPTMPAGVGALPADFAELRWTLCAAELARYRELGALVSEAVQAVAREVRPGQSEFETGAALTERLNRDGIRTPVILMAADERISLYRHPVPTDRKIRKRILLATCAERGGLICSVTRLVSFEPLSDELRRKHAAVVRVDAAYYTATQPGRTLGEILAAGQAIYAETGFADEWKLHHQGGPMGYLAREAKATPGSTLRVRADQAFGWNPSITGTKSEDTIIARPDGAEIITASNGWPMIEVSAGGKHWPRPDILIRA